LPLLVLGILRAPWCFLLSAQAAGRGGGPDETSLTHRPRHAVPARRAPLARPRGPGTGRGRRPTAARAAEHAHSTDRRAWAVWASAALQYLANLAIGLLVGAPYSYEGQSRKPAGPRWIWYFWVRLPLVIILAYLAFPVLCRRATRHFPLSESFSQIITSLFAPIVSLIYAIIAGQVVVSLWGRLHSVRILLNRELAALEVLERKLPGDDPRALRLFAEHVVGIDKYALRGALAPNHYNKLAELASLDSLKDDDAVQDLVDSLADLRAERRATTDIGYPRSLWGTLRVCAIVLIGCFVVLAQGFGAASAAEQRGVRIVFCLFILTVFWVNHLCRDMADLSHGEFQIDADAIRHHTALGPLRRRASEILGDC